MTKINGGLLRTRQCPSRRVGLSVPRGQTAWRSLCDLLILRTRINAVHRTGFEPGSPWIISPNKQDLKITKIGEDGGPNCALQPHSKQQAEFYNVLPTSLKPSHFRTLTNKWALHWPINPSTNEAWTKQAIIVGIAVRAALAVSTEDRTIACCPPETERQQPKQPTGCLMRVDKQGKLYYNMGRPCACKQLPQQRTQLVQLRDFNITAERRMTAILPWRWQHTFSPTHY